MTITEKISKYVWKLEMYLREKIKKGLCGLSKYIKDELAKGICHTTTIPFGMIKLRVLTSRNDGDTYFTYLEPTFKFCGFESHVMIMPDRYAVQIFGFHLIYFRSLKDTGMRQWEYGFDWNR